MGSERRVFLSASSAVLPARIDRAVLGRAGRVAGASAVAFAWMLSPLKLCLVATVLHIPCPGCGLTRACLALARGDLHTAVAFHPLSVILVPLLGWFLGSQALRYIRTGSAWSHVRQSRALEAVVAVASVLLIAVWIARFCGFWGGPVAV